MCYHTYAYGQMHQVSKEASKHLLVLEKRKHHRESTHRQTLIKITHKPSNHR